MEPERAHKIGLNLMKLMGDQSVDGSFRVKTKLGELRNPIGNSAGFDKTAKHLDVLQKLGFGYLVAGTVTLTAWPGHPKPRIARNPSEKTMVNALGFPNPGVDKFIENLERQRLKVPVVASVSGRTIPDIVECYGRIQSKVAGVELNLSSPNTSKLADFRELEVFTDLVKQMVGKREKPTYLKIPPLIDDTQFSKVLKLVKAWSDAGFDGVTAANAMPVKEPRVSIGTGGFSGPPLFPKVLSAIGMIRREVRREDFEVNACGGISDAQDVKAALAAGANTVQIFTAIVFEGPGLIKRILTNMKNEKEQKLEEQQSLSSPATSA